MKKVGILLGSFDPIHIGHIAMITEVLNKKLVDKVLIVPTRQNPWKPKSTDFDIRCKMIESIIIQNFDNSVCLSYIEETLEPPFYTYKTLQALKARYKDSELYLIGGSDTINSLYFWDHADWILSNIKLIGVIRNNVPFSIPVEHQVKLTLDISSFDIREMVKENKIVYPYITKNTYNLIKFYNLYGKELELHD